MRLSSLDSIYKKILSVGNQDANQMYPPWVFDEHFNIVSAFILDRCVELYPERQSVEDIIRPFIKTDTLPVKNGEIKFPDNYRNYLNMSAYVTPEFKGGCGCEEDTNEVTFENDPLKPTKRSLEEIILKSNCRARDVAKKDLDEFNKLTVHPYKKPTYKLPICCVEESTAIRICPFDIVSVRLKYVIKPKQYRFGYVENADGTFTYNETASTESEWDDNGLQFLFKGIQSLFSVYTKDREMQDWVGALKQIGLI